MRGLPLAALLTLVQEGDGKDLMEVRGETRRRITSPKRSKRRPMYRVMWPSFRFCWWLFVFFNALNSTTWNSTHAFWDALSAKRSSEHCSFFRSVWFDSFYSREHDGVYHGDGCSVGGRYRCRCYCCRVHKLAGIRVPLSSQTQNLCRPAWPAERHAALPVQRASLSPVLSRTPSSDSVSPLKKPAGTETHLPTSFTQPSPARRQRQRQRRTLHARPPNTRSPRF